MELKKLYVRLDSSFYMRDQSQLETAVDVDVDVSVASDEELAAAIRKALLKMDASPLKKYSECTYLIARQDENSTLFERIGKHLPSYFRGPSFEHCDISLIRLVRKKLRATS